MDPHTHRFPDPYGSPPIVNYPRVPVSDDDAASPCNVSSITPACLQWLYSLPTTPATHGSELAVTGYDEQWPQRSDLAVCLCSDDCWNPY